MKLKHPVAVGCAAVLLFVITGVGVVGVKLHSIFAPWQRQMKAGRAYMDSLTETDIQRWIERTKPYLLEYDPKNSNIDSTPVPPDLSALKIIRIDVRQDDVSYVWMGGFDHTELIIERQKDGFRVTASYDDHKSRVIWQGTPANPQGGANGKQPSSSEANQASPAAASRRSP